MVRFENVGMRYGSGPEVLRDVSFSLEPGSFTFLTGLSGAGKTTLLKLIYVAEPPSRGLITLFGTELATARRRDLPAIRRRIGVVFQDFRLLPDRTAEQNVAFALEVTGAPSAQIAPKVARLLTQVGLDSRATAYPHELSGGEQQRVAIARALANDPFLLLADEPTGNLDDRATHAIYLLLREVNAQGTSVIMATHDVGMIQRAGLRCLALEQGQLAFDGTDVASLVANMRGRRA